MDGLKLGHRKALDGLRGLAILLVILCHIRTLPLQGGFIGVDLFFVLSGFLITTLLLEEWQATGGISLKAFYARRALRLLPALLVVLGAIVLLSGMKESAAEAAAMRKSALPALFYSANWFMAFDAFPRMEISPFWSLSVEEQFYFVWPLALLLLLRLGCPRRAVAGFVVAALLASAAARVILWNPRFPGRVFFGSDTHADGLLAGVLTGLLFVWGAAPRTPGASRALTLAALGSLGLIGLLVAVGWQADASMVRYGYPALNLAAAVLVASLVLSPAGLLRRAFEFGPLVWIGRISYGVYLWHIAVFWGLERLGWSGGSWHWPAAVGLTFALAAASFYGLERPILRYKRRFEKAPSSP